MSDGDGAGSVPFVISLSSHELSFSLRKLISDPCHFSIKEFLSRTLLLSLSSFSTVQHQVRQTPHFSHTPYLDLVFEPRLQSSMPLPTLPPELLFIIRELALPEPPFADYSQYLERNGILRRFATVHSSWLEFARRQLARHVFVYFFRIDRPSIAHQRRMIDNLSTALKSDPFRFYKTLSLVIHGRCRAAMEWIDDGRWSEIQYLECAELQDGMLQKFPCEW